jgi:hypothetical protein
VTLDVLTWHVHGSYLYYLAHAPHRFLLPVREGRPEGYGGRGGSFAWPDNVVEVPAAEVRDLDLDLVLTQSVRNWEVDAPGLLSEAQRRDVPRVHLEHDPPKAWPNEALHPVQDPETLLVHVTPFNELMWDNGVTPTAVVQHGVVVPSQADWTGELDRAVTVVNNLGRRGRRLGPDVFTRLAAGAPIDLAGMNAQEFDGVAATVLGDVPLADLHGWITAYRCFVNPIRYTSMGLAVCEAMALGLPVVGLATTEMAAAVRNGVDGYVDTDVEVLAGHLARLLADRDEAAALSAGARQRARERFGIERFARDWDAVLRRAAGAEARGADARGAEARGEEVAWRA